MALSDRINLSAFWPMGTYEAARTLDHALHKDPKGLPRNLVARAKKVKQKFARPRMLLPKHEPATRHTATDLASAVARRGDLGWKVAPRLIVTRRALADMFLKLLERIASQPKRPLAISLSTRRPGGTATRMR
jgi:hypothetical protein